MSAAALFTIIFGTTASGKSDLAYKLAMQQSGNVLSFDSRHVYIGLDVVTGKDKPGKDFSQKLYGQDLVHPDQDFSIRHFYEYAKPIIEDHRQRQQPLVLVGGSWLYAQVLLQPPASLFIPQDKQLRAELAKLSIQQLQQKLKQMDQTKFESLNHSDQHNQRRLIRAIEVAATKDFTKPTSLIDSDEHSLKIVTLPFEQVEKNIEKRIEQRLSAGALEETRRLRDKYQNWSMPAFSSTGYQYLSNYLDQEISLTQLKELWFIEERNYAKRQLTWVNRLIKPVAKS